MFLTATGNEAITANDASLAFYAIIGVVVLLGLGVIVFWINDINSRIIRNHRESVVLKRRILRNMRYYTNKLEEVMEESFLWHEQAANSNVDIVVDRVNRNTNKKVGELKVRLADEERDDQKEKRKARSAKKTGIVSTMPVEEAQVQLRDSKGRFVKMVKISQ